MINQFNFKDKSYSDTSEYDYNKRVKINIFFKIVVHFSTPYTHISTRLILNLLPFST
jgi:hypothetical protein